MCSRSSLHTSNFRRSAAFDLRDTRGHRTATLRVSTHGTDTPRAPRTPTGAGAQPGLLRDGFLGRRRSSYEQKAGHGNTALASSQRPECFLGRTLRDRHTQCEDLEGCGPGGGYPWLWGSAILLPRRRLGMGPRPLPSALPPPPTLKQPEASDAWGVCF